MAPGQRDGVGQRDAAPHALRRLRRERFSVEPLVPDGGCRPDHRLRQGPRPPPPLLWTHRYYCLLPNTSFLHRFILLSCVTYISPVIHFSVFSRFILLLFIIIPSISPTIFTLTYSLFSKAMDLRLSPVSQPLAGCLRLTRI